MFKLYKTSVSDNGLTLDYHYEISPSIVKYFNKKETFFATYDRNISAVPQSILNIPLLANVMPIAWFVGFDVYVDEIDETFYNSLLELKAEFSKHFPNISPHAKLHVKNLISNAFDENHTALLFSGGLDSFESLVRNLESNPFLVSVLGADIKISDTKHWNDFVRFNKEEQIVDNKKLCYVASNLRTFYTYEMDLLANLSWWGTVQHGMALLGLIAPLSFTLGIRTILIASSNTGEVSFGWGSTSETDEKVKWANTNVIHDGFHLKRTEKIQNIVDFARRSGHHIKLRVCYSDSREGYNCSQCAKCQRTMLGIILCGENPDDYGFDAPSNFYDLIFKNFGGNAVMTTGVAYEWRCLQEKARECANPFVINDAGAEKNNIDTFAALPLSTIINTNAEKQRPVKKVKFIIMTKFPQLFKFYLKLRRQF